nr:hypothetical protein [Tanacetum cinerariifolium]
MLRRVPRNSNYHVMRITTSKYEEYHKKLSVTTGIILAYLLGVFVNRRILPTLGNPREYYYYYYYYHPGTLRCLPHINQHSSDLLCLWANI